MNILTNICTIIKSPKFYIIIILSILLIVLGSFTTPDFKRKMEIPLLEFNGIKITIWSVTHILLYVYFGYYFPNYFIEFLIIGCIWEIFEYIWCKLPIHKIMGCTEGSNNKFCNGINQIKNCQYWYGTVDDILMNSIGFIIGACISINVRAKAHTLNNSTL